MDFTKAQEKAINTNNCSLLVAAGAGSGKTRVLTERIIAKLLDDKNDTDITKFLIVTFTNAAAKELSERISGALSARVAENNGSSNIVKNLVLLPQAKISTIDSFCFDLVKENYQKFGLAPKVRIAEDTETGVILERIIEELIEEKMSSSSENEYFLTLYEIYSETDFFTEMEKLYENLLNIPTFEPFLKKCCDNYLEIVNEDEFFNTFFGKSLHNRLEKMVMTAKNTTEQALNDLQFEEKAYERCFARYKIDIEIYESILNCAKVGYNEVIETFKCLQTQRINTVGLSEYAKNIISSVSAKRKSVIEFRDKYFSVSFDRLKLLAEDCYNIMKELSDIMLSIHKRYMQTKTNYGLLTFNDVERYALEVLYDDIENGIISKTAHQLSKEFDEIYIDEYQDINGIQDMIFSAITKKDNNGNEYNRFMVGDVKQSIYGFRGADPEIFEMYRDDFDNIEDTLSSTRKIFMQDNFRCSENIIAFTNMLFEVIMPEGYSEEDKLFFSKNEKNKVDVPVKLILCNTDEPKTITTEERKLFEAECVYKEIINLISNPENLNSEGERYKLSDIAILTQKWKPAVFLEEFLRNKGVPVVCERGEQFFDRKEIKLAINILESVDNPQRDIATAGFMRSNVLGFNDDELTKIRLANKKGSFFNAVKEYKNSKYASEDENLNLKIQKFLDLHEKLRLMSRQMSISEFVRRMYAETDLINACNTDINGHFATELALINKKNLMRFYDMAREYDKTVFKGLNSFVEYVLNKKNDKQVKSSVPDFEQGIRIMTIHKSKGLEFPVCFLFGTAQQKDADKEKLKFYENLGIGFKIASTDKMKSVNGKHGYVSIDTPFKNLIKDSIEEFGRLEGKRVLYVALTRAKERLIITASPLSSKSLKSNVMASGDNVAENLSKPVEYILGLLNLKDKLENLYAHNYCDIKDGEGKKIFEAEMLFGANYILSGQKEQKDTVKESKEVDYKPDENLLEEIKSQIIKRNTASQVLSIPPKLTVSLLKHGLIEYDDTEFISESQRQLLDMPEFVSEDKENYAEKGIAMHLFMQFAEFGKCENDGCEKEAQRLYENNFITEKQLNMLDIEKLDAFFKTNTYISIKNAKNVYRELRFNLKVKADEVISDIPYKTDDFVLVQGVIDCFIENADGTYTVIDFKTDRVKEDTGKNVLLERYSGQLEFYCKAVEDITKSKVKCAEIFSFTLMDSVEVCFSK